MGSWYRPPATENAMIISCSSEHNILSEAAMGTILLGDVNVHHQSWLKHSARTTNEGEMLR
eukprot:3811555-Karenia_brevis.AAC.1